MSEILLWVDDDGPDYFEYEAYFVRESGYSLHWATDVAAAIAHLSSEIVLAVLLDQMLPLVALQHGKRDNVRAWTGCMLLHWLRGAALPSGAPEEARRGFVELAAGRAPVAENQTVPVQVVSAFYDPIVLAAIKAVGSRAEDDNIIAKPIDKRELARFISFLRGRT